MQGTFKYNQEQTEQNTSTIQLFFSLYIVQKHYFKQYINYKILSTTMWSIIYFSKILEHIRLEIPKSLIIQFKWIKHTKYLFCNWAVSFRGLRIANDGFCNLFNCLSSVIKQEGLVKSRQFFFSGDILVTCISYIRTFSTDKFSDDLFFLFDLCIWVNTSGVTSWFDIL